MEFNYEDLYKEFCAGKAPNTTSGYPSKLNLLGEDKLAAIKNHQETLAKIDALPLAPSTKRGYLNVICGFAHLLCDKGFITQEIYKVYTDALSTKTIKLDDALEVASISSQLIPDKDDLQAKWQAIREDTFEHLQAKIVLYFYVMRPCLRSDVRSVKIDNYDEEVDNYFDGKKVFYNKLVKVSGKMTQYIEPEYLPMFDAWLTINDSDYLIGKEMTDNNFCQWLKRRSNDYFGDNWGIKNFRPMWSNYPLNDDSLSHYEALKQCDKLAKEMNHSIAVQHKHYIKKPSSSKSKGKEKMVEPMDIDNYEFPLPDESGPSNSSSNEEQRHSFYWDKRDAYCFKMIDNKYTPLEIEYMLKMLDLKK